MRAVPFLIGALLCSCTRQRIVRVVAENEGPGQIEGTVIYEDGRPVRGATVSAFPLDRGLAGNIPSADTDELGHFQINRLWLGIFAVMAKKEDEGYADTNQGFYSDSKIAPVTLSFPIYLQLKLFYLGQKLGFWRARWWMQLAVLR